MFKKFNVNLKERFRITSFILVAISTFFLGGLFVYNYIVEIKIPKTSIDFIPFETEGELGNIEAVFASSRGSKYYTKFCNKGNNISPKNIIWFSSAEEAENSGYTIAAACR